MKKFTSLATIVAIALTGASQANAQSFSTSTAAYNGPAEARLNFDSPLPSGFSLTGGHIITGNVPGVGAQPLGSTGNYLSVPMGFADINAPKAYDSVNFLWGSIDAYNTVTFFDEAGKFISKLTGVDILPSSAAGNLTPQQNVSSPASNLYLTYSTAGTGRKISGIRLDSATTAAFETDNFSFFNAQGTGTPGTSTSTSGGAPVSVPEPGMLALFGLGALGLMASKRKRKLAAA